LVAGFIAALSFGCAHFCVLITIDHRAIVITELKSFYLNEKNIEQHWPLKWVKPAPAIPVSSN
jgi:hypothetical protein